jgi:hypothetical protein
MGMGTRSHAPVVDAAVSVVLRVEAVPVVTMGMIETFLRILAAVTGAVEAVTVAAVVAEVVARPQQSPQHALE